MEADRREGLTMAVVLYAPRELFRRCAQTDANHLVDLFHHQLNHGQKIVAVAIEGELCMQLAAELVQLPGEDVGESDK